ncbi:MAG: MerR family transcriptional regulator [Myxococcales bacterium]|nr:MerR family transcriptional regulator [Myxococcales bacterium]
MELIRIGELAKRSGVSVPTLKHYLREGLIAPVKKSGRTMAWYHPELAGKVKAIKELQRHEYLPLDVIRDSIEEHASARDDADAAESIARVLATHAGDRARTRDEILAKGDATAAELGVLAAAGLAVPGADGSYRGDDLAVLSTLGAARKAGLSAEMLPFEIIDEYLRAIRALVAIELKMFRAGVIPRAKKGELPELTETATKLSERLVVLLRRKLLLPTMKRLMEDEAHVEPASDPGRGSSGRRVRRKQRRK